MTEDHDPNCESVEVLKLRGRWVEPRGDETKLWLVDGKKLTDGELLALALGLGLMVSPGLLQ